MNNHNYCVIMAGGIGSRFWPVSREERPKQFLSLTPDGKSFLRLAFERFSRIVPADHILVVSQTRYHDLVAETVPEIPADNIILEPYSRNTAPCIALATYTLLKRDPDAVMVATPADHMIQDEDIFDETIRKALDYAASSDALITLGIVPDRPDTNFGYIQGVQDGIETYMFSDKMVPTRKELTEVVSAYLLYCFAIHYWYGEDGEEGDLAKSLIAAVKDLAFAKIKNTISTLAGDVLKKFAHSIGEKVGPQLCALFEKQAKEGALKAGSQAFEKTLREQAKAAGKVTFEGAKKALETKGTVIAFEEELARGAGEVLKKTAPKYAEGVAKDVLEKADFLLAHVLNYFFAGTLDTNELLGNSTHEVLINAFCDRMKAGLKSRWGLDVEEVSEKLTNPLDVSAKLDGNLLTLSIFSCSVVIDIQKNLEALFGILFELSFGWMEDLWKYLAIQRDFNVGIDDPEYDKSMFERMADRARQAKEGLALEKRKGK